jgi:hypothetical protein
MQLYQSVKVFTGQGVEKIMMWQGAWFYANPIRRTQHQMFFNYNSGSGNYATVNAQRGHTAKKIHITGTLKLRTKEEKIHDCCYMSIFK